MNLQLADHQETSQLEQRAGTSLWLFPRAAEDLTVFDRSCCRKMMVCDLIFRSSGLQSRDTLRPSLLIWSPETPEGDVIAFHRTKCHKIRSIYAINAKQRYNQECYKGVAKV